MHITTHACGGSGQLWPPAQVQKESHVEVSDELHPSWLKGICFLSSSSMEGSQLFRSGLIIVECGAHVTQLVEVAVNSPALLFAGERRFARCTSAEDHSI